MMTSVKKSGEATQALELLEEYHRRLTRPDDLALRQAIERVINIFKSRLFQALLDIQEFYEITLLDDRKSTKEKAYETNLIASRMENSNSWGNSAAPALQSTNNTPSTRIEPAAFIGTPSTPPSRNIISEYAQQNQSETREQSYTRSHTVEYNRRNGYTVSHPAEPPQVYRNIDSPVEETRATSVVEPNGTHLGEPETADDAAFYANGGNNVVQSPDEDWEYEDIVLEKGRAGLGFSIAGGSDNPHIDDDPGIYVTKIIDGGAAAVDGRLRVDDVILRVNLTDTSTCTHNTAVEALKHAGNTVRLLVKRLRSASPRHQRIERIELRKGVRGLGFSIAGGVGNEHIPGDIGIYVTKIIDGGAAQMDGRLEVGDKVLSVNSVKLDHITHEEAVNVLKRTNEIVTLTVVKTPYGPGGMPTGDDFQPPVHTEPSPVPNRRPYEDQPPATNYSTSRNDTHPQDVQRGPRRVHLHKGQTGLGFNIVGGEGGEPIYISHIAPGGAADLSGTLHKGDQLLEVNGIDLRGATHEIAARTLKNAGSDVQIGCQYRPEDYKAFEDRIDSVRNDMIHGSLPRPGPRGDLFARALFDYDPSRDSGLPRAGLPFIFGDILHIVDANDEEWWTARRVSSDGREEEGLGIIPSRRRVDRKERARRKSVNFNPPTGGGRGSSLSRSGRSGSMSFSRKFPFMKSKERLNEDGEETECSSCTSPAYVSPTTESDWMDDTVLSYEVVEQKHLDYKRPVIVLGPLRDRINDDLINEHREQFGSAVPHTTREKRPHEVDGRDYHFVHSRDQMQQDIANNLFIEAGQYNGNLYGTSLASVRELAEHNKHCVLDVSGNAIRRLQDAGLYPIAIFVKPYSIAQIMEWNRRLTPEEAERLYSRAQITEADYAEFFTAIVQGDTPEQIYERVKQHIRDQSRSMVWLPGRDQHLP